MRRITKIIAVLLLSLILAAPASALRSSVYFLGLADGFIFHPGSDWSETDLFDGFKNVMPGDRLTETIDVRNATGDCDTVKIYFKAEIPQIAEGETPGSMAKFLSQLGMQITQDETVLFDASPADIDLLAEYVQLGEFAAGESATLNIVLNVPLTLGSEYMHRTGVVDWVFMAECYVDGEIVEPDNPDEPQPIPNPTPNGPRTLDLIEQYYGLLIISAIGLIISVITIRRLLHKAEEQ